MWIGIFLVVLGAVILLQHMGIIHGSIWGYVWPVVLIAVGISFISRHSKRGNGASGI